MWEVEVREDGFYVVGGLVGAGWLLEGGLRSTYESEGYRYWGRQRELHCDMDY